MAFVTAGIHALGSARHSFVHKVNSLQPFSFRHLPVRSNVHRFFVASANYAPENKKAKVQSPYTSTVNLPQTAFEQRANAPKREPEIQEFWSRERVYERLATENNGDKFVLHDGPPFANGPLHCGHALNKVLKDIIVRYRLMTGHRATFIPGWDTHGLPIELKVLQGISSKKRASLSKLDLRKRAREFANETVERHIEGMRRFGIWADWDNPYLTMQPEYEAAQIGVFGRMFQKGYIFRGRKPVHWSPSSRTALAEAELEYPENHTSRSCYCTFPTVSVPDSALQAIKDAANFNGRLFLSIWTTTPWTLPANRAVAVNESIDYAIVQGLDPKAPLSVIVIAKDLVESVASKLGTEEIVKLVALVKGKDLVGIEYQHPLDNNLTCRVVAGGDYITTETGTGLVHTAPGHGAEDYQTGLKEGLELASPVDDAGRFTDEAANGRFTGLSVMKEGNEAVLSALKEAKILLLEEKYAHKYPYDWRTKKPTIFRATEQWFISVDEFRDGVLKELENVNWFPATGVKRIRNMVLGRGDWCISRQRVWGVPIPVFYDQVTGEALMNEEIVSNVQRIIAEKGGDAWWELDADELLPAEYRGRNLKKGTDTMDVWFDSGSSWAAVASLRPELEYPSDIYLEGSDQHRGWFQSSILTSVAVQGQAPYKNVLTHGFVLDQNGVKMSKSIGNVMDPMSIINGGSNKKTDPAYGADMLRLWVSSVDYSGDVMIGKDILKQVFEVYRKLRNTARYIVGNIHDFDPKMHAVPFQDLPSIDKYMLSRTAVLIDEIDDAYKSYSFVRVYQAMQRFAVVELSNFYLEIAKDRLYIPEPSSFRRRSCQTVLALILESYARAIAPIMPHTAEDLWQKMPYAPVSRNESFPFPASLFESGWLESNPEWSKVNKSILRAWAVVLDARDAVNKVLQAARTDKTLGASMEAAVKIYASDPSDTAALRSLVHAVNEVDDLKRAFIVSDVRLVDSIEDIRACKHTNEVEGKEERFFIGMDKHWAKKCDRCWHYCDTVGSSEAHPMLCDRCTHAVISMGVVREPEANVAAIF